MGCFVAMLHDKRTFYYSSKQTGWIMTGIAGLFFKAAVMWFIIGVTLGMTMGITGDHSQIEAHAHINLLGWVSSALFALYYRTDRIKFRTGLQTTHFVTYNLGLLAMLPGLYLAHYGVPGAKPAIGAGSFLVCFGILSFAATLFTAKELPQS